MSEELKLVLETIQGMSDGAVIAFTVFALAKWVFGWIVIGAIWIACIVIITRFIFRMCECYTNDNCFLREARDSLLANSGGPLDEPEKRIVIAKLRKLINERKN